MPSRPQPAAPLCWVLSDGKAGTETQACGLAAALGLSPVCKRPHLRTPWRQFGPGFRAKAGLSLEGLDKHDLGPPWPTLTISAGRRGAMAALVVRALATSAGHDAPVAIQIQDPRSASGCFDYLIVPEHDRLHGDGVFTTLGGLHSVTPESLGQARERWAPRLAPLPKPRVAVLIGGRSRAHDMPAGTANVMAQALQGLAKRYGASIMATVSRRTPKIAVQQLGAGISAAGGWLWDGAGANPYLGMLAWADYCVVTSDSVTMASEAAVTGRPVYIYPLPGGNAKFARFHAGLRRAAIARPFDGALDDWSYPPLLETRRIADLIAPELRRRGLAVRFGTRHDDPTGDALSPAAAAPHLKSDT